VLLHSQIRFDPTVVAKGDFVGHPFRGNQWSDASGASTDASSSSASKSVTNQIDNLIQMRSDLVDDATKNFRKDHFADFLQKVADLGYEFDKKSSRSYVMLDGVSTYIGNLASAQPDHPISKLYNEFYVADDLRRDKYFEVILKDVYGAFDLTEGVSVHDAATQLLSDKVKAGTQSGFNGTNLSEQIDHFVRSEADHKTEIRYVRDEGCTGPTGIGKGATGVNKALRAGRVTPFAKQIDASMLITNQPFAGYRGASLPQSVIDQMVVGSSYTEKGFMSVSPLRDTATFYANERHKDKLGGRDAKIVIFRMLLPKGTKANPMNTDEIVVARKSTVRIAAVREINDPELGAIFEVDAAVEQ